jgi:tetrahydromethanopterin S-methyltransferase subunit E
MDPITLGVVALMGAAATIAGAAEDLESDIGSMSNPNSQVQLAPQMGHLHRLMNRAVSGEPVAYGTWCGIAGSVAFVLISHLQLIPIIGIALGAAVAALVIVVYTVTSHMGRIVSQSQFEQPLFMDVLTQALGPIAGHGFIATFGIVSIAYLMTLPLNGTPLHVFPLPLLAVIWGITIGAIGSSTGDNVYGSEIEYQNYPFGGGIPVAIHGDIVTKGEIGARGSLDIANFSIKFGSPLTGFCFGSLVFLSLWITVVFGLIGGLIAGLIIVILLIIANERLENFARTKYGPYKED